MSNPYDDTTLKDMDLLICGLQTENERLKSLLSAIGILGLAPVTNPNPSPSPDLDPYADSEYTGGRQADLFR